MNVKDKTIIIGVTGSLGTGKSTVAEGFRRLGARVLDADKIAHSTFKKNTTSYRKVLKEFGRGILDGKGRIDRSKLSDLTFGNKKRLNKLCRIIHPIVIREIKYLINMFSRSKNIPAVVVDAPLLIEAGLHKITDYLVIVKASRATQIKRTTKKTGLKKAQVSKRIRNQMPLSKKIKLADFVIDNEGSKGDTEKQIKKIWEGIKSERK